MIPKGNQRGGGQQLATHLLNAYDNDSVEVADVRGAIAPDLHGAFAEWYAEAKGTKCVKYLYSLSINPDHTQGPYNREHYNDFIRRTEDKLGLVGQPRAVVFHVKHGREHCHVVWSRIDTEKMKAVQLSHDRQKLRAVAQEYARDHNLTLPPGMRNDRGKDRFPDHAKTENLAEKQQEERTGTSKKQRMEEIAKAWRENPDGRSFVKALEAGGYFLARGDKRSYVVVDLYGEVHSLSRQLTGVKAKELKARLAEHPPDKLADVATVQDRARARRQALLLKQAFQQSGREERSDAEPAAETPATARERREALQKAQAIRRADLESKRQQLVQSHNTERKALADMQSARSAAAVRDRAAKHPTGVLAFLTRVTGFDPVTAFRNVREELRRTVEHRLQTAALARRHRREMQNFKYRERGLASLDKRERRSLETSLRRDGLRQIARQDRSTIRPEFAAAAGRTQITKGDDERTQKLKKDFVEAAGGQGTTQERGGGSEGTRPDATTKGDLQRAFEQARAARKPSSGQQEHTPEVDSDKQEQARKAKEELEQRKPQPPGPERDRER
ncbi:MAG: relaxase/mobilization nuclease domain-containing protein [Rhizomicrobium sp.]